MRYHQHILLECSIMCAKIQFFYADTKRKVFSLDLKVESDVSIFLDSVPDNWK